MTFIKLSWKPEIGQMLDLGRTCQFVRKVGRYVSAELAEDGDEFEFADTGYWTVEVSDAETEQERETIAQHRALQKAEQEKALAAKQAAKEELDREVEALEAVHQSLAQFKSTDYYDYEDLKLPRIPCQKPDCPSPETCWHNGSTWWQQEGWTEVLSTRKAGWVTTGNQVYKHPTQDIYLETFGNRVVVYAAPELVDKWLEKKARELQISKETAQTWLQKYSGCVGAELYEWAARNM